MNLSVPGVSPGIFYYLQMKTHIALIRGINVSGQKLIKMAELKSFLLKSGFADVETYIQSGNILFTSKGKSNSRLAQEMSGTIKRKYGFEVEVLVYTIAQWETIVSANPYYNSGRDHEWLYFTMLQEVPKVELVEKLKSVSYPPEEYILADTTIYFYSPNGYGKAKMNNNFFEGKLKVKATTRNLRTMEKLLELAKG
jgi:uncharacterized protein (DUF1697 family)